jgi:type II secretion system protein C
MNINYNLLSNSFTQISLLAFIAYCLNFYLYIISPKQPYSNKQNAQDLEYIFFSINDNLKQPKGNVAKTKKIQTLEVDKTPQNTLNIFKLTALYSINDETGWVVIEIIGSRRTRTLSIGDNYKNYQLQGVFAKYATFKRRGKTYVVYLQKEEKYKQYAIDGKSKYKDKIKVLDDKIQIKKTFVQKYVTNSNDIWREIAINENRVNGKIEGFIITGMSYNSVFKRLGLQKGDVLMSVNNKKLNSYSDALKIYKQIKTQKNIHLVVNRNGDIKEIDYELY